MPRAIPAFSRERVAGRSRSNRLNSTRLAVTLKGVDTRVAAGFLFINERVCDASDACKLDRLVLALPSERD
jgi:hypothetical protein